MEVFSLKGQVVNQQGYPIINLRLAIVDKDLMLDDLIGVGFTNEEGRFKIDFTHSEFNQELGENEKTPDIYIVFSTFKENRFVAIDKQEFYHLKFKNLKEDLGTITIETFVEKPQFLPDINPTPGYNKKVKRLKLSNEMVAYCLEEVCPRVETLTSWKNLLDDLNFEISNNFSETMVQTAKVIDPEINMFFTSLIIKPMAANTYATYDPFSHTIFINEELVSQSNFDALKVVLGHELVHVGQFKYYPELKRKQKEAYKDLLKLINETTEDASGVFEKIQKTKFSEFMNSIEGYASYIQDFLQKDYNCATFISHQSFSVMVLTSIVKKIMPEYDGIMQSKSDQYEEGKKMFQTIDDDVDKFRM